MVEKSPDSRTALTWGARDGSPEKRREKEEKKKKKKKRGGKRRASDKKY